MTCPFRLLLVLGTLSALLACGPTTDQRCSDIDQVLESKGTQLSRTCANDDDCVLVEGVHPDRPVAANATPEADPELSDLRLRRIELCGDFSPPIAVYEALCVEQVCTARAIISIRDDVGPDGTLDPTTDTSIDDTTPTTDADPDVPVDDSLCGQACANVDACDLLLELGLGVSIENCVSLCNVDVEANGPELAMCLSEASCDAVRQCF